jgi:hypothetical protein
MALQQVVPDFMPAQGLGVGAVRPLKRMVKPTAVAFRKGGSLNALVAAVQANRSVAVEASAGAGKSTLVPGAILASMGGLLIHVFPSAFLAAQQFVHVSMSRQDCALVTEVGHQWPESGWAFASAAVIQAKFLSLGKKELPECVLYHDEVHRSDVWTNLIGHQWGSIPGVLKYITASATTGLSGFRQMETDGSLRVATFDPKYCDKFDVYKDVDMPWSVDAIFGNTLIWEDRAEHAAYLVNEYSRAGFEVFRLHSRMKEHVFGAALHSLASGSITVFVADSSFRDGYTWDLACTIDTGIVQTTSVINGVPSRVTRNAYEGEVYQGACRGGRTPGSRTVAWRPNVAFERKRVALEEVEMDAVALVSRLLCDLVPIEASDSILAEGNVPRDLLSALQGTQPLACLTDTQTAPLAASGYERAPSPVLQVGVDVTTKGLDYYHVGVSADTANRIHQFRAPTPPLESKSEESVRTATNSVSTGATDWTSELATWAAEASARPAEFQCGLYYYSPSVKPEIVASAEFPEGWSSVVKLLGHDGAGVMVQDMDPRVRTIAIAAGLQRFNLLSCEMNAVMAVARDVKALGRTRSAPLVHTWMNELLEKTTALNLECGTVARLVTGLVVGFCEIVELPQGCLDVHCKAMASRMFEGLREIPVADVTPEAAAYAVRLALPDVAHQPDTAPPLVVGASDLRYTEMAHRGRTARVKPPLSSFNRWVIGYGHNSDRRRIVDSLKK